MPTPVSSYDATQGGTTFRDLENQPLSYSVTILSAPPGFAVQGTRIVGMLSAPGFVRAKIEARDRFGAVTEDTFAFVVPTPISTRPTLPAQSFVYEDRLLTLPNVFTTLDPSGRLHWSDTLPQDNLITNAGATLGRVLILRQAAIDYQHALLRFLSRTSTWLCERGAFSPRRSRCADPSQPHGTRERAHQQ